MYYLIKGKGCGTDGDSWDFEWVAEADNEEQAKTQLNENEKCIEIKEISIEECIKREKQELQNNIISEHMRRRYSEKPISEYFEIEKEIKDNPVKLYEVLKEYNKSMRFEHRLFRRVEYSDILLKDFFTALNGLIDAKTDDEAMEIINKIPNKKEKKPFNDPNIIEVE